ncbi:MAG TPA: hypothetical protein VFQ61_26190 [Polyangiaceae bacterium]|nr:hypothetical protein [Polyangiaceae bacterium]
MTRQAPSTPTAADSGSPEPSQRAPVSGHAGSHAEAPSVSSSGFSVSDYLQLAGMARRTVMLAFQESSGRLLGRIYIDAGEPRWAQDRFGLGEAAFRRLVTTDRLDVVCNPVEAVPANYNLSGGLTELLMHAVHALDESRRSAGNVPPARAQQVDSAVRPIPSHSVPVELVPVEIVRDLLRLFAEHVGPAAKPLLRQLLGELGCTAQTLPRAQLPEFVDRMALAIPTLRARQGFVESVGEYWQRWSGE